MKFSINALVLGAALFTLGSGAMATTIFDIAGRYDLTTNSNVKIIIDNNGRMRTNLQFNTANGVQSALTFPHFVKQDDFTDRWTNMGQVAYQFVNVYGQGFQCNYPVKVEAEFSADYRAMDVTLTYAQQFGVDAYGRCVAAGSTQQFLGFNRE